LSWTRFQPAGLETITKTALAVLGEHPEITGAVQQRRSTEAAIGHRHSTQPITIHFLNARHAARTRAHDFGKKPLKTLRLLWPDLANNPRSISC